MSADRHTIDIEVLTEGLEVGQPDIVNGPAVTVELDNGINIGVIPGLHYLVLTEEQYDNLDVVDDNMFYFIYEDEA